VRISARAAELRDIETRRNVLPRTFSTFDATVSERPLTELRDFPSYSAVPRLPCSSSRMRDVKTGESERLYRPTRPGPVERREPSDFGKLRFRLKWQIAANPWQGRAIELMKSFVLDNNSWDAFLMRYSKYDISKRIKRSYWRK